MEELFHIHPCPPPHTHTLIGMLTHTGNSCTTLHNVKGISLVLKDNVFKIRALI